MKALHKRSYVQRILSRHLCTKRRTTIIEVGRPSGVAECRSTFKFRHHSSAGWARPGRAADDRFLG